MDTDALAIIRAVADQSPSDRAEYYERNHVPAPLREEVEARLLSTDGGLTGLATTATHPAFVSDGRRPATIGRYEVVRLLGRGGMGEVYLARDPVLDREIAVKLIGGGEPDGASRKRLVQEARAAGRLRHPNIVTIFDAGEHDGRPYIAMEHVRGETLASLIRRRAELALARRLEYIEGACAGLAHAHRADVIHLDVKPDNLMLDESGVVKVLDFGIARVLQNDALTTRHLVGTLSYMSPEQITGRPLDRRSDVFSLGCSLFELVAYVPAYRGSAQEIIRGIADGPVPSLLDVDRDIDPRLEAVVRRAMAIDPAHRYGDLDDLRMELAQIRTDLAAGGEHSAAPAIRLTAPAAASPPSRFRSTALAVATAAALAGGAYWMLSSRTQLAPTEAVNQTAASREPADPVSASAAAPVPDASAPAMPPAAPAAPPAAQRSAGAVPTTGTDDAPRRPPRPAPTTLDRPAPPAPAAVPEPQSADPSIIPGRAAQPTPPPTQDPQGAPRVLPPAPQTPPAAREANPSPTVAATPSDTDAVLAALKRYHDGYEALDVAKVVQVFPGLAADQIEQLKRTFGSITTYAIEVHDARVDVRGDVATVRAVVSRRIVPRVGRPVSNEVPTEFRLRRDGGAWVITNVAAETR